MTSKSLKRSRHKAALKQKEAAAAPPAGPVAKKRDWTRFVSEAMVAGRWQDALQGLAAIRGSGKVPKLGTIQRWVRLADLSGEERLAARLLDSIMRAASSVPTGERLAVSSQRSSKQDPGLLHSGSTASLVGDSTTGDITASSDIHDENRLLGVKGVASPCVGSMRRHPSWAPPALLPTDAQVNLASPGEEGDAASAAISRCEGRVHVVGHDQGPAQDKLVGALANAIFMTEPGLIHFETRRGQDDLRKTVPMEEVTGTLPGSTAEVGTVDGSMHEATSNRCNTEGSTVIPAPESSISAHEKASSMYVFGYNRIRRVEVPFVPGAFVLTGVLSRSEAAQIVAVSERMGYSFDADYMFSAASAKEDMMIPAEFLDPGSGNCVDDKPSESGSRSSGQLSAARASAGGERAAGCVWLADDSLLLPVWERVRELLPQQLGGGRLLGINARWRLYRYDQGTVYRPHVDGAWPGSGLKDGKVVFDAFGDRWSRLTFLVYLNEGFEGGSTTFYTPGDQEGVLDAWGVSPRCGNVLVFPHGDTTGSLVHEGSAVTKGVKYVIRSDVLYEMRKQPHQKRDEAEETTTRARNGKGSVKKNKPT